MQAWRRVKWVMYRKGGCAPSHPAAPSLWTMAWSRQRIPTDLVQPPAPIPHAMASLGTDSSSWGLARGRSDQGCSLQPCPSPWEAPNWEVMCRVVGSDG